ncbi:UNVERIFIED_CONTAM: putative dehydrogenase [Williamsia faeni]
MGISHLSIAGANPKVEVVAVCDTSAYLLSVLSKYTGVRTYNKMESMLAAESLDAVIISTPSNMHAAMVRTALSANINVFCEKPFCLDPNESAELAHLAEERGLVTQVGYHNRFIGAFAEVKRLLETRAIGEVSHVLAESYGPVVLKPKGGTWRTRQADGGGCLYDYAAHPIDLLNWYFGEPETTSGSLLRRIFSKETDDEVYSTFSWRSGPTGHLSVNWSDESQRKMTTMITIWGKGGKIYADRQECRVYLRNLDGAPPGYNLGWNARYTTSLTSPVNFYLRGEEYSAQLDEFVERVNSQLVEGLNDFRSAAVTDRTLRAIIDDATSAVIPRPITPESALRDDRTSRSNTIGTRVPAGSIARARVRGLVVRLLSAAKAKG